MYVQQWSHSSRFIADAIQSWRDMEKGCVGGRKLSICRDFSSSLSLLPVWALLSQLSSVHLSMHVWLYLHSYMEHICGHSLFSVFRENTVALCRWTWAKFSGLVRMDGRMKEYRTASARWVSFMNLAIFFFPRRSPEGKVEDSIRALQLFISLEGMGERVFSTSQMVYILCMTETSSSLMIMVGWTIGRIGSLSRFYGE